MDLIWLFISRIVVLKRKKKLFFGLWHCSMLMGMFCSIWLEWFSWLDDFFFLFCGYGLCSWRILYHFTQYFVCFILSSNSWWLFSLLLLTLVFQFCPSMVGFQIIFIYFLDTIKALLFLFLPSPSTIGPLFCLFLNPRGPSPDKKLFENLKERGLDFGGRKSVYS